MQSEYDAIVVRGELAGISAALSAARLGCKIALVQDRPHQSSLGIMAFPAYIHHR